LIHLHTHSQYSLRDSIIRPDELASRLQELGQGAVAITDHGGSLGGISLYKKLKKAGIKYIHGCELYVCDDVSVKDKNNRYYHLVALCKDDTGRLNLNKLISMSEHPDRKYYKPRVDFAMLQELGGGMIFMSACLAGEVSRALLDGDYDKAKEVALRYKEQFGEDYYLEIQSHRDPEQERVNHDIVRLAHETGISLVVTTDAHYLLESDKDYQNKYAFNGSYKEDGEAYVDCFIQTEDEVRARLQYLDSAVVDEAIANTHRIADRCNVEMPLSAPIMPHVDVPDGYRSSREWLESLCEDGFKNKLRIDELEPDKQVEYRDRCKYELDSLERMGFLDYILLVYSYANVARRRGIARGSGGGSLVCFLTNITNIDPVEHGLYFERFIDVGAIARLEAGEITAKELKIPDVDLDFGSDSCNEVLRFLYDKYGEENVASIGKFGNNHTNGTIRDMCRVLNIDLKTTGEIAAAFENYEIEDLDKLVAAGGTIPEQARQALRYAAQYPDLFRYVRKLNGLPKSFGLHACGRVISTNPLDIYLPSCYDKDGIRYLQGDMHDVEDVGLVKIDVLGLRTVDQMYDTMEMLGESLESIDPKRVDFTDPKVLDVFKNGDTVGIFQFSSGGMRKTLKNMDPRGIDDLSIANALFRPGSLAYIDSFCKRRRGEEECFYIHPDLEPILRITYGIIVFQEQLIEIGRLAGIRNPDLLRKATGKKDIKLLEQIKPELADKLMARGWSEAQFNQLWSDMLAFASYSFNKAHSQAYAIIGFLTAKQKAYHPAEFFAGLCNSYLGQSSYVKDDADEIISDMLRMGVKLAPFDFRKDHRRCWVNSDGQLEYAIPLIRDCSDGVAQYLYNIRDNQYDKFWKLVFDVNSSCINQSQTEILIQLGFFNEFGPGRKLWQIFAVCQFLKFGAAKKIAKEKLDTGQFLYPIVERHSKGVNNKGVELKGFQITDMEAILNEAEESIMASECEDFSFQERIKAQQHYLGFISMNTGKEEDRRYVYVKTVRPAFAKKTGRQFGTHVITRSIGSGKESLLTIMSKDWKDEVVAGDILYLDHWTRTDRGYFNLDKYRVVL